MKKTDRYHRWVAWSEDDRGYLGRCPDLFAGAVHDDDPIVCAERLQWAVDDVGADFEKTGDWPAVTVRPTRELVS
jgi:hypothetical protein